MRQGEGHVRPREGHACELLYYVLELNIIGLEELAAGGDVVEEVAHGEGRPAGRGDLLLRDEARAVHDDLGAEFVPGATRAQGHLGHGRYRGQGLAAETESDYVVQVLGRLNLGGGVTLEAEHGVTGRHAAAVVDDLDERAAGVRDNHGHRGRPGVQGVLHEFLDH